MWDMVYQLRGYRAFSKLFSVSGALKDVMQNLSHVSLETIHPQTSNHFKSSLQVFSLI